MLLSKLFLVNFRNFAKKEVTFSPNLTLIVGENARGKTSLLEAIFTSVHGRGYRESREIELLTWDEPQGYLEAIFKDNSEPIRFQIRLLEKNTNRVEKQYFVNKTAKSSMQYKEFQTKAVLFAPEHISIIDGSPSRRRNYFDSVICEFYKQYRKHLRNYEHALRRRNKVLEFYKNEAQLHEELLYWNDYLETNASYITQAREEYVTYLNNHNEIDSKKFRIEYQKNVFLKKRLDAVHEQELRQRRTVIGPQKDEFTIYLVNHREKDVHLFGSRSEQRLSIFWLKLSEIRYFEEELGKKPILLLDDVFSELDEHNKELVMKMIPQYQTVITTTEENQHEVEGEVLIRL